MNTRHSDASQDPQNQTRTISVHGYAEIIPEKDTLVSFVIEYREGTDEKIIQGAIDELGKRTAIYNLGSQAITIGLPDVRQIPTAINHSEVQTDATPQGKNQNRKVTIINTPDGPIPKYSYTFLGQDIIILIPHPGDDSIVSEIQGIIEQVFPKEIFGALSINTKESKRVDGNDMKALREKAMENGLKNAEEVAKLLGGSVGKVLTYSEEGSDTGVYKSIMDTYSAQGGTTGNTKSFLTVTLTYELKE